MSTHARCAHQSFNRRAHAGPALHTLAGRTCMPMLYLIPQWDRSQACEDSSDESFRKVPNSLYLLRYDVQACGL